MFLCFLSNFLVAFLSILRSICPAKACQNGRELLELRTDKFWSRSDCRTPTSLYLLLQVVDKKNPPLRHQIFGQVLGKIVDQMCGQVFDPGVWYQNAVVQLLPGRKIIVLQVLRGR